MSKTTYRILVGVIALLFIGPIIQRNFHVWTFDSLKGEHYPHQKPKITLKSWLDGSYQQAADKYCTDSFGFQSPMVRGINQIDYSLFREANAQYVIVGKENCLYETPYIEAHLGMDYLGDSVILEKIWKYKQVSDTLEKLGVKLNMIFAPGKASFHETYIPDYYWQYQNDKTNYVGFKTAMNQLQMAYIDLHAWFRNEKGSASAPLFPLTGIHWSKYGMVLATDSILNYWNSQFTGTLPHLSFNIPDTTTIITKGSDADVEDGLNIIQQLPHFNMIYPSYHFVDGTKKIKTAVIADSYYWGLFDIGLSTIACDSGEFWYYFKRVYPQNFKTGLMIEDLNIKTAIESKDVITILQTDATLNRFGFGFIEAAYELYYEK
ncbi:MAG: hypothetical protein ACI9JN_000742 [Bacteroidia bacterium]|jgi:hypothetical protein